MPLQTLKLSAWRTHEAMLNQFAQYTTTIDGQKLHFLHVRSPEPHALPLIITHGWPGSVVEFTNVIGALTDPQRHGGAASDAFHVVAPSIPGFGFSGPTTEPGWDVKRIARAFAELMVRLGYDAHAVPLGQILETRRQSVVAGGQLDHLAAPVVQPR